MQYNCRVRYIRKQSMVWKAITAARSKRKSGFLSTGLRYISITGTWYWCYRKQLSFVDVTCIKSYKIANNCKIRRNSVTCRRPRCALLHSLFLPACVACQLVKQYRSLIISVEVRVQLPDKTRPASNRSPSCRCTIRYDATNPTESAPVWTSIDRSSDHCPANRHNKTRPDLLLGPTVSRRGTPALGVAT